jgi:dipeptidyl aminopeptidase/acylaminoacyl peptidase
MRVWPAARPRASARAAYFSPSFSPNGPHVAYVSDRDGASRVWLHDLGRGDARPLTPRTLHVDEAVHSPTAELVAVSARRAGTAGAGILLVSWDGRLQELAWRPEGVTLSGWSRDGARLWLAASMTPSGAQDACAAEVPGGTVRLVLATDGLGVVVDDDPGRGLLLLSASAGGVPARQVLLVEEASGQVVGRWSGSADGERLGPVAFSPGGFLAVSNRDREFSALVEFDLDPAAATGSRTLRERAGADLESVAVSRDGRTVLLTWNTRGRNEFELTDLSGVPVDQPGPGPAETAWGTDLSADGQIILATLTGPAVAPSVWQWARDTARWAPVAPGPDGATSPRGGNPVLVPFRARDGLALEGWFYPGRGDHRRGCVIALHGGPAGQARPEYDPLAEALQDAGIAVFAPNIRGSRGYGRTFQGLDDRAGRFAARSDVVDCARHLFAEDLAEPGVLGVLGSSSGGYYAICALLDAPDLFAAGVSVSGVVDPAQYIAATEAWRRDEAIAEFGNPETDGALLAELSPLGSLTRLRAPLLLVHGTDDAVVPPAGAIELASRLRSMGRPSSLRLLPGEGHSFTTAASARAATREVRRWFVRHLTPVGGRRQPAAAGERRRE